MINLPNLVTLSRVPALFIIAGFMMMPWRGAATAAFILFILGGITDWLDGYLARKYNLVSNIGKFMDSLTDKIMTVGMMIALQGLGMLPRWALFLVLLIVSREFFVTGLRLVAASQGVVLAAERAGKVKTVFQIVAISVILFVPVVRVDVTGWSGWDLEIVAICFEYLGLAIFLMAAGLTISSGTGYVVKYWNLLKSAD